MPKLRFSGRTVNLSSEQYKAVKSTGNGLVLACPGSGKTRLLTCKAVHLLQQDLTASQRIILITFTKKAANEMMHRAQQLEPENFQHIMIGTFHHLAYQIMKHSKVLDKNTRIIDEDEQNIGWDTVAGNDKDKMQDLFFQAIYNPEVSLDETEQLFIQRYKTWKTENHYIDFSDIILLFIQFLKSKQSELFHQAYSHIMVDECQDLNQLQFEILKLMFPHCKSITLVGDISQSIYGFRYANPEIVYQCEREFNLDRCYLTKNYRSSPAVIYLANKVIPRDMEGKETPTANPELNFYWCNQEFSFLVDKIEKELRWGTPLTNMLIMARSHWYLNLAATVLLSNGIPIQMKTLPIQQRPSGKKVVALFRILMQVHTSLDIIHWNHWGDLDEIHENDYNDILARAFKEFTPSDVILIKAQIGETETLKDAYMNFLKHVDSPPTSGVILCTIHQSKGMEYPVCFLIGAGQQYIPHAKAESIEEEKRLLYVAITRAINKIYISCSAKIGNTLCKPTPFLVEIMNIVQGDTPKDILIDDS